MKDNKNKMSNGAEPTNAESNQKHPESSETFDFIKSFVEHVKCIFCKFTIKTSSPIKNEEFINLGRTEGEKEQIAEMCQHVDEGYELLSDLRGSNLTPEMWLQNKTQEILHDCTEEEQEIIIQAVEEEGENATLAQAEYLDESISNLQMNQNKQTEE